MKNEVDAYVKSVTSDVHQVKFRIALLPPPPSQITAALHDGSPSVAAIDPEFQIIRIPAERVPPEFWKSIPPDLQMRLNEVNGVDQIVSEMWVYHGEQINAQSRQILQTMAQTPGQPAQTQVPRAQLEAENERRRQEMKALLQTPYTPGMPNSQLTKSPVRIEIIQ